jgi:hypothetical protein
MIQLTPMGTCVSLSSAELAKLRHEFDCRHWVQFPQFIEPGLLDTLLSRMERGSFSERTDEGIASEACLDEGDVAVNSLILMANDGKLHNVVEQITGCGPIGCFTGRIYRLVPGAGHIDSWHDDLRDTRLVALSVNLSRQPYEGGDLQIRRKSSGERLEKVRNTSLGQAVLFRISPELEHRVAPVEGRNPRTAFAGWFRAQPNYESRVMERLSLLRASIPH